MPRTSPWSSRCPSRRGQGPRLARVYGGGGIPVYWLVNIPGRQLEVYAGGACTILGATESVELVIDGQVVGRIAVASLLPRSRGEATP